jgi:uncharacterized protein
MRIFLDANSLFSAAKSDGAAEEARRNLAAKAPERVPSLEKLLSRLHLAGAHSGDTAFEVAPQLPEKDQPVLAAAIRLRCEALVTGDRSHFGSLYGKKPGGVAIHSPRSLAELLL